MTTPYLVFDRGKLQLLKSEYEASIAFTLNLLPPINWNSPKQIKDYFWKTFGLLLDDVKITTLAGLQSRYEYDPAILDVLIGAVQYFKLKTTLNNYITFILKSLDEHDRFYLKEVNGIWMIEKQRPIFRNQEIWACVKSYSADLVPLIEALNAQ